MHILLTNIDTHLNTLDVTRNNRIAEPIAYLEFLQKPETTIIIKTTNKYGTLRRAKQLHIL